MNGEVNILVVCGINHKTSTISDREIFQINRKEIPEYLNYFSTRKEVEGALILSTCNRIEFYLVLKKETDVFSIIKDFYSEKKNVNIDEKKQLLYFHYQSDVARHLFKVICGLDSMLVGEYQIQGQIRESYSLACSGKTADKILHKLFHAAFRVGKNVRTQTKIGSGKQSLSGVAFQIIKEKLSEEDTVTIIGVNENTKIIAEKLYQSGFKNLVFVNRTLYKAEKLADKYSGTAFSIEQIENSLLKAKCIFSCTASPDYIISNKLLNKVYNKSKLINLIIDMAFPRDINTTGIAEEIETYDLEGLKNYLNNQKREIVLDYPKAEKIITNEAKLFKVWSESQEDETVAYFTEKIESIRLQLLDEATIQASEDEIQMLDKFSRSLTHRLKATINQAIRTNDNEKKAG